MTKKPVKLKALSPEQLDAAIAHVRALSLAPSAKQALLAALVTARAGGETAEAAIASMDAERRAIVAENIQAIGGVLNGAAGRGGAALMQMSDDEWNALMGDE